MKFTEGDVVVRVKICGITRPEDAMAAVRFGADAIGMVFSESLRAVTIEKAQKIAKIMPPFVVSVGVFVNESPDFIRKVEECCCLDLVQLHGEESPEMCDGMGNRVIKAIRVRNRESILSIPQYRVRAILLDTYCRERQGGTGMVFDWEIAREATGMGKPLILSGGLNPDNVASALREVEPYGVDVSSGVESAPGVKDHEKVRRFIEQAKAASREIQRKKRI